MAEVLAVPVLDPADPGTPLIVVRNSDQDRDEILWQARTVGYDHIVGELAGGMGAWTAAGQPVATTSLVRADTMCGHGERAASAASMLERAGRHDVAVLTAAPSDWAAATGRSLEVGE